MSEKEADALMKSGRKHLEKTMLKWKPNHDSAADDFEKAAKIYLQLHLTDKCIDAYTKASHEHGKAHNAYFSAKCLEALAQYLSEDAQARLTQAGATKPTEAVAAYFTDIQVIAKYYEQAADIYFEDSKLNNQSEVMNKASQLFTELIKSENRKAPAQRNEEVLQRAQHEYRRYVNESLKSLELNWEANEASPYKLPDVYKNFVLSAIRNKDFFSAIQAEKRMLGIVEKGGGASNGNSGAAAAVGGGAASFSVDNEVYDDSRDLFKRLKQPHNAVKVGLEVVVLILAFNSDYIWVNREMEKLTKIEGFSGSPEENCVRQLVQAYEERDEEMLADTIRSQGNVLNFLLSDVSRLAKKLTIVPTAATGPAVGAVVEGSKPAATAAAAAAAGQSPMEEEEDASYDPAEDLR